MIHSSQDHTVMMLSVNVLCLYRTVIVFHVS